MFKSSVKTSGFSLVEMAIVVTIMGVLAGGVLAVSSNKIEKTSLHATSEKLKEIDDAIKVYYARYGKIPCPAFATAEEGTSGYGMAIDCTNGVEDYPEYTVNFVDDVNQVVFGNVPVRTLGLPESMMYDEWGSRIMYGAVVDLAKSRTLYANYTTFATDGVIKIVDGNGNQVLDPKVTNIVPYVLISYGKDKKGALGRKIASNGMPAIACGSAKDSENCDFGDQNTNDAIIVDTQINDANTNDYYYDLVRWTTKDRLKAYDTGVAGVKDVKGYSAKCAIKTDDTLWCWGDNRTKILGDLPSGVKFSDIPVSVGGKNRWLSIDMAEARGASPEVIYSFICGIKADKSLWCWGDGRAGHLGSGVTQEYVSSPEQVSGGGQWKSVYTSYEQVCAIKLDDTLWCWGAYTRDIDGIINVADSPTQVGVGYTWKNVSVGATQSCGVRMDNSLWCWGVKSVGYKAWDGYWELLEMPAAEPIAAGELWKSVDVAGGVNEDMFTPKEPTICAIKLDDTLWCWGNNDYGQLGDGTKVNKAVPAQVSGGGTWKNVFVSTEATCAIKSDNALWCWGKNNYGQLGDGTKIDKLIPSQISGGGEWRYVSLNSFGRSCGIRLDDSLWCWARHAQYYGPNSSILAPALMSTTHKWKTITKDTSCAIDYEDKVMCGYGNSFVELRSDKKTY